MEAKDRLLTSEEMIEIEDNVKNNLPDGAGNLEFLSALELAIAREQVELIRGTYNRAYENGKLAGMKEIVEWIKSHSLLEQCDPDTMSYFTDYYAIVKAEWEDQLKEWKL